MRRMSTVIDVDLSRYFDTIRHSVLLDKIAKRIQDPQVMHLVKQIIKVGGKVGVPQGGPFSPLAANIYLNEVDWFFDAIRRKTAEGGYEAVNYHRFADDIVITVNGHHTKRGWAERARQRLQEQIAPLGVELNLEKTKVVDMLSGEAFGFLGFDLRRVRKQSINVPESDTRPARVVVGPPAHAFPHAPFVDAARPRTSAAVVTAHDSGWPQAQCP
jgi:hypothetical protein